MLLSVIICTHNPRSDYLFRTLDGLKTQTLPKDQWELLLIDNASQVRLADNLDISWHPHSRHIREEDLGLTSARLRGIIESRAGLLVFVDDDNVLAPDFLEQVKKLALRYPNLGAFGAGVLRPEFETQPPSAVTQLLPMLALRRVTSALWTNNIKDYNCIPWGAGLCVTRNVAIQYVELIENLGMTELIDRRGRQLCCGGDDLFSLVSAKRGGGFGIFPELQVTHLISAERLRHSYFLRLVHDHRFSHAVLNYRLSGTRPRRIGAFSLIRLLLHCGRRGPFSMCCRWASERGEAAAARFISVNRLTPLELDRPLELIPPA